MYFCPSNELSLFQLIFIVRSYVVLLYHCTRFGGGDPANMFNPATFCMYVPVPSQDPVIQWLSFVYVLHICFSFIFVRNLGLHCFIFVISEPIIADYVVWTLFIVEGRTVTYNC